MFQRTALFAFAGALVVGVATLATSAADALPKGGGGPQRVTPGGGPSRVTPGGGPRRVTPGGGPRRVTPGGGPSRVTPGGGPRRVNPVIGHGRHLLPHNRHRIHFGHLHRHRWGCWRHPWLCRPWVRPHFCWRFPWHGFCNRRIYVGGYYPVAAAAPVVARPVASTCTCLRKTYLPNGAVMFQDVCTNESAVNPPNQAAQGS